MKNILLFLSLFLLLPSLSNAQSAAANGDVLRTYRMAWGYTGELAVHQNMTTKADIAAYIAGKMNAVNAIWERDFAVTFELIPNNDELYFLDITDPHPEFGTAVDGIEFYYRNITITDSIVGPANYDKGFLLARAHTGRGGNCNLCTGDKAGAVAALSDAIIRHEIGHNFCGDHTYTLDGGGDVVSSARSITGAGGTYMHVTNLPEALSGIQYENMSTCPVETPTGNSIPVMSNFPASGLTVPANTPFQLSVDAVDADNDPMTFTWQQRQNGNTPQDNLLFAHYAPSAEGIHRHFPRIETLKAGETSNLNEYLPAVSRTMEFGVVVRDNNPAGGAIDYFNIDFDVVEMPEIFTVNKPDGSIFPEEGQTIDVEWTVAGTSGVPINCANVNILLSTDGGATFPHILATNVPNDGAENVIIPTGTVTTEPLIKVEGAGNLFFNISTPSFEILPAGSSDFSLGSHDTDEKTCDGAVSFEVNLIQVGAYLSPITLSSANMPAGTTSNLPLTGAAGTTVTVTFDNLPGGAHVITLDGVSNGTTKSLNVTARKSGTPSASPGTSLLVNDGWYESAFVQTDFSGVSGNTPRTVEAWIKTEKEGQQSVIAWTTTGDDSEWYEIWLNQGKINSRIEKNGTSRISYGTTVISDGEWHHIAVINPKGNANLADTKMYIDGQLEVRTTATFLANSNDVINMRIGRGRYYSMFDGEIDEVRVWSRVLSPQELRENMHLALTDICSRSNLEAYFQFDESGGNSVDLVAGYNGIFNSQAYRISSNLAMAAGEAVSKNITATGAVSFDDGGKDTGLDIDFGMSPDGDITVTRLDATPPGMAASTDDLTASYWVVRNYGTNAGLDATMTFKESGFVEGDNPAAYTAYKRGHTNVDAWTDAGTAETIDVTGGTTSFIGIDGFSQWIVSKDAAIVLPIDLLDFRANADKNAVNLNWTSNSELNFSHYEIERSQDGINFDFLEKVAGRGGDNSTNYTSTDKSPFEGKSYYRLKMTDLDGTFEYSVIRSVIFDNELREVFVYPNPIKTGGLLQIEAKVSGPMQLTIFDIVGKNIGTFDLTGNGTLRLPDLTSGVYGYTVAAEAWTQSGFLVVE